MRAPHTSHPLPVFPICSATFISPNELVLGGGGGASKTGVKNKLKLLEIDDDRNIKVVDDFELGQGEDAPMSMAADPKSRTIICGINSTQELMQKGQNENCRAFAIKEGKLTPTITQSTLTGQDLEDFQKVTALSPNGELLVAMGTADFSVLALPSLTPAYAPVHVDSGEYYDVSISESKLLAASSKHLYIYNVEKPEKTKGKGKASNLPQLELVRKVGIPDSFDATTSSTYRAARFHPTNDKVMYAVVNCIPHRAQKVRSATRQSYICKMDVETGKIIFIRKIGDKTVVAFDVSPNGKLLAYAFNDYTVGILDSHTLAPLVTILKAHEFAVMALKFNPTSKLLVSGSADCSVRVVTIPDSLAASYSATFLLIILALLVVLAAMAIQFQSSK